MSREQPPETPTVAWRVISALLVAATVGALWGVVEWRSAPPPVPMQTQP